MASFATSAITLAAQQNDGTHLTTQMIEAGPTPCRVTITVLDPVEARVPSALVEIDPFTPSFQVVKTDNTGQVAVGLPDGTHSFVVSARGFRHWNGIAEVRGTEEVLTAKLIIAVSDYPGSVVVRVQGVGVSHSSEAALIALQPLETLPLPAFPISKQTRRR